MNETTRSMMREQEEAYATKKAAVETAQFAGASCGTAAADPVPGMSLTPQIVRDCRQRQRELRDRRDHIENQLRVVQELLNVWEG